MYVYIYWLEAQHKKDTVVVYLQNIAKNVLHSKRMCYLQNGVKYVFYSRLMCLQNSAKSGVSPTVRNIVSRSQGYSHGTLRTE